MSQLLKKDFLKSVIFIKKYIGVGRGSEELGSCFSSVFKTFSIRDQSQCAQCEGLTGRCQPFFLLKLGDTQAVSIISK